MTKKKCNRWEGASARVVSEATGRVWELGSWHDALRRARLVQLWNSAADVFDCLDAGMNVVADAVLDRGENYANTLYKRKTKRR